MMDEMPRPARRESVENPQQQARRLLKDAFAEMGRDREEISSHTLVPKEVSDYFRTKMRENGLDTKKGGLWWAETCEVRNIVDQF